VSGGVELAEEVAGGKHISVMLQIYTLDRQALFEHAAGKTSMPAPAPSPPIRRLADLGSPPRLINASRPNWPKVPGSAKALWFAAPCSAAWADAKSARDPIICGRAN
jgi:hypothetical protein